MTMMLDKILEWGEGGAEHNYHNVLACMDYDVSWVRASTLANLIQSAAFLVFSIQMVRAARMMHTKEQKATIYSMVAMFALWSLGSYTWDAFKMYFPVYRLHTMFVWAVAILSWILVLAELRTASILKYFQKVEYKTAEQAKLLEQIEEYRFAIKAKNEPPRTPKS
jgi:hypothetical protein